MLILLLWLLHARHAIYWLQPVPYADGHREAAGLKERPDQLEYG
ncbi:hypothetical protein [Massilia sp. TN1-12]